MPIKKKSTKKKPVKKPLTASQKRMKNRDYTYKGKESPEVVLTSNIYKTTGKYPGVSKEEAAFMLKTRAKRKAWLKKQNTDPMKKKKTPKKKKK